MTLHRTPEPQERLPRITLLSARVESAHDFLKALASPGRQQIMLLFARGVELSVNQVAERAGISQPTASQQLALLRRGGIVTARRDGKEVLYQVTEKASPGCSATYRTTCVFAAEH